MSQSIRRTLPDDLEQDVLTFLNEKLPDADFEIRAIVIENPNRDLFFISNLFLSWGRFDLMDRLFAIEPNIANIHKELDENHEESLLLSALYSQNLEAFRWLLEHGAKTDEVHGDIHNSIWMMLHFENTHYEDMAALLLAHGGASSLTLKNDQGFDAFRNFVFIYGNIDNPDEEHYLDEKNSVVHKTIPFFERCKNYVPQDAFMGLMGDAAEAQSQHLIEWLINEGDSIQDIDRAGNNVLINQMYGLNDFARDSTVQLNSGLFQFFIDHGVDVNFQNEKNGNTALHVAASFGHQAACRALLDAGAEFYLNDEKQSCIEIAKQEMHFELGAWLEQYRLQALLETPEPNKPKVRL